MPLGLSYSLFWQSVRLRYNKRVCSGQTLVVLGHWGNVADTHEKGIELVQEVSLLNLLTL